MDVDMDVSQIFEFPHTVPGMADAILNGLSYQSIASSIENPSNARNSCCSTSSSECPSSISEAFTSDDCSQSRSGSPGSTVTSTSSNSSSQRNASRKNRMNNEKVKVFVRMRPFLEYEKVCPLRQVLCLLGNKILIKEHIPHQQGRNSICSKFDNLEFEVDYVQDDSYVQVDQKEKKEEAQKRMYNSLGDQAVNGVLNGQNITILSYGQADTGKTYTIYGDGTQEGSGLMPRMACELLQQVKKKCMDDECKVEVSYLEIYQEKVRDLLAQLSKDSSFDLARINSSESNSDSVETASVGQQDEMRSICSDSETMTSISQQDILETGKNENTGNGTKLQMQSFHQVSGFCFGTPLKTSTGNYLKLREHPVTGTYVEGLSWKEVSTWSEMERLLRHGAASRTTVATEMNRRSSQSHTLFTLKITWMSRTGTTGNPVNYLNLVDLAGSEKLQNASIQRRHELKYINKSLSQLNSVILSLSRSTFVSYRNSALTWLLKESLGGDSSTFLVANVSPAEKDFNETVSTLKYASKAKHIHSFHHQKKDPRRRLIWKMNEDVCSINSLVASLIRKKDL